MQLRMGLWTLLFCVIFAALLPFPTWAAEENSSFARQARSAILMDADSGTILFEKNSEEKLSPASITKIMTMLLIMEALEKGTISYDDKVRVSERAASMGGSQIFLEQGETMKLEDMLKGVAVGSGNDASVALAEHVAGTEEAFVERMNQRAQELGMNQTRFQNPTGLSEADHYTSARDVALMSKELLKHPEITRFTRIYDDYLRKETKNPFWLVNTNRLVRFYEGMDGLKTGFTQDARYCLAATAKRGNLRLIAVVMGEPNPKARNREITGMLDYAFSQYESHIVYKKGEMIDRLPIDKGMKSELLVRSPQSFSILTKKGENPEDFTKRIQWERLRAPIQKGQRIGEVLVEKNRQSVSRMELISTREIPQADWWTLQKRTTRNLFFMPEHIKPSMEE